MQTRTVSVGPGASTPADSQWLALDTWAGGQITYQAVVTGTVSYAIQTTNDDTNSVWNPVAVPTWDSTITGINNQTSSVSGTFSGVPVYIKVRLASGSGSVALTVTQSSNVPL